MRVGALGQPVFNGGAALTVGSVWGIDIDGGIVPALFQSIMLGQAVFHLGVYNRILVGAWVKVDFPIPETFDGIDILWWCTPGLAKRIDVSSC